MAKSLDTINSNKVDVIGWEHPKSLDTINSNKFDVIGWPRV